MKDGIVAVLIGGIAGVLGGLFGIGGGILIVPALIAGFGFSQHKAQGTSLVALLAPVGILALREYYRNGDADLKLGGLIAAGFLFGAFAGSKLSLGVDETTMRRGFALFLILTAAWLTFGKQDETRLLPGDESFSSKDHPYETDTERSSSNDKSRVEGKSGL